MITLRFYFRLFRLFSFCRRFIFRYFDGYSFRYCFHFFFRFISLLLRCRCRFDDAAFAACFAAFDLDYADAACAMMLFITPFSPPLRHFRAFALFFSLFWLMRFAS